MSFFSGIIAGGWTSETGILTAPELNLPACENLITGKSHSGDIIKSPVSPAQLWMVDVVTKCC